MGHDNQAVTAFILFRSMEGVERSIYAYKEWRVTKIFFSIFDCLQTERQKFRLFRGHWLKVTRGVEPELLLWENFGVTGSSKLIRLFIYIIFVLIMLTICFYIILLLERASNNASDQVPDIQCPSEIDSAAANIDFLSDVTSRAGDFHCFCKRLFEAKGI